MTSESDKMKSQFSKAIEFVNKVKTRFANDDKVYESFLEVLEMHREGNKSVVEVYKEVTTLFKDHDDLHEEFAAYLPSTDDITEKNADNIPEKSVDSITEESASSASV